MKAQAIKSQATRENSSINSENPIRTLIAVFVTGLLMVPVASGQSASDPQFKVKIDIHRWHDVPELKADMERLEEAWPKFLKLESIGKSYDGHDLMLMTINNPDTGPEMSKAAMYIEANIHGNEIQGAEVALYTIWYLMENYGRIEQITQLVDERVFYIVPTVNPDGRQYFMEGTGASARSAHVPVDNDGDGLFEEDPADDLNGNNVIEQIRKYVPGNGTHRISRRDPRIMEPVPPGETGDYILLGQEGIDNDGDGRLNEDAPGGYDPNRNWASDWQPDYIQGGSMDYPFQLPDSRAINEFLMAHPNIAGVQSFHNSGGMILRGPGAEWQGTYPADDIAVYDELGRNGERMLPYYRYIVIWSGLYTVHGGMTDWTNDGLGIVSFANELWNGGQYFNSPDLKAQQEDPDSPISGQTANYFFDDFLEFGDEFMDWTEFDHPQFGPVELGGTFQKMRGRIPPRFMNEELAHRNMAFTLYQADQMPKMRLGETNVEPVGGSSGSGDKVFKVWIDVSNPKVIPTITTRAAENNVVRPDLLTLEGDVEVISASWIDNKEVSKYRPGVTNIIDQNDLKRIMIRNGQPGQTTRTMQYLVRGTGEITITYDSVKGGTVSRTLNIQ